MIEIVRNVLITVSGADVTKARAGPGRLNDHAGGAVHVGPAQYQPGAVSATGPVKTLCANV